MAKVRHDPSIRDLRGAVGNFVYRLMPDGRTYVSGKQDFSRRVFSEAQSDHQTRFRLAAAYACQAARTQPLYAELARGTMKSAYNFALSDWFHPPVIHQVQRLDQGRIRIQASDDVRVEQVRVLVLDENGRVLEQGNAVQVEGNSGAPGWWEYVPAAAEGRVLVEVCDLPGHITRVEA